MAFTSAHRRVDARAAAQDDSGPGRKADRRAEILAAAGELIQEGGPAAASVRAVAARAGVGASTLRHYFPTQQALSEAVFRHQFRLQGDDRGLSDTSRPAAERLTDCLLQFLPSAPEDVPALRSWLALYNSTVQADGGGLTASLSVLTDESYVLVRDWLGRLRAEGVAAPDDAETAARLLSRVDGLCLGLLNPGAPIDLPMARRIMRAEVRAVLGEAAPR